LSIFVLIYMKIIYIPLRFQVGQFELMDKTALFRQAIGRLFFLFLLSVFLTGCAAPKRACPPLTTAAEATAVLKEYSANLKPLRATGNCTLNYTDGKGQKVAQSFPVRIWFQASHKFCLYGDVAFDPKAVCFAIDGYGYWTYAKPLGRYVRGKINTATNDYFSNPAILVDFLEPLDSACDNISILNSNNKNNILACQDRQGCKRKKIFIDRCSRFVKKIEYFNCSAFGKPIANKSENPTLVVESDEYKNVTGEKFSFPHKLVYRRFEGQKNIDRMQIKLDSVKVWQANPAQLKALFTPPDANSFQKNPENKETK